MQPTLNEKVIWLYEHRNRLKGYLLEMVVNAYNRIQKWKNKRWNNNFDHNESIMLQRAYDRLK